MSESQFNPKAEEAYETLWSLREELDEEDMLRPRKLGMRLHPLVDEARIADESSDRLQAAVNTARQAGLSWDRIGEALGMSGGDAVYQFEEPTSSTESAPPTP
jgi:hypothetical protein